MTREDIKIWVDNLLTNSFGNQDRVINHKRKVSAIIIGTLVKITIYETNNQFLTEGKFQRDVSQSKAIVDFIMQYN